MKMSQHEVQSYSAICDRTLAKQSLVSRFIKLSSIELCYLDLLNVAPCFCMAVSGQSFATSRACIDRLLASSLPEGASDSPEGAFD